ncbi:MAG: NAD(+) synthase [Clostridia bacterium]|nr:NAD(+) synthase [Clostridia bacterium]
MQYGFIKVCAATPEIKVADVSFNTIKIIDAIKKSADNGSQLTVFPELCICGYTCGDLFNQSALIKACENAIIEICKATKGLKTLIFVGAPIENFGKLYNCAVAIHNGAVLGIVPKTYLPNYGEFYEKRNFCSAPKAPLHVDLFGQYDILLDTHIIFKADNCEDFTVSAEICEDLWAPLSPSVQHTQAGANIIVNLSCSNETAGKAEYRKNLVKMQSGKLICGYVYSDAGEGESSTDLTFAGHNLIAENGAVLSESKLFENGLLYGEIDVELLAAERRKVAGTYFSDNINDRTVGFCNDNYSLKRFETNNEENVLLRVFPQTPFIPSVGLNERSELILKIQQKALEKRLKHTNSKTAIIGVSGGLDSSLALIVAVRAFKSLGKDLKDIIAVTMPCFGTTEKTKNNSLKLIKAMGVTAKIIPISQTVKKHFKDINHKEENKNITYENAQARVRTLVLMDLANEYNGLVIGTGDLSELALGWATYNGDHMSMYSVNCSVPKTLIRHLVAYEAEKLGGACKNVLNAIVNTEISPELLPPTESGDIAQKTEDIVGPYVLHDFFLYYALKYGFSPEKIKYIASSAFSGVYDQETVEKWLKNFYKRFFAQQFKRSCLPDGVKVGSVSLSPRGDWRMPSDAVASVFLDNLK